MHFPTAVLFLCLLALVGATFTDPYQLPGFGDLPLCVQSIFPQYCPVDCFDGGCIPCDVGCGTWTCTCGHDFFAAAISAASSVASTGCTRSQEDAIASATSVVNGFCSQLLARATPIATGPTEPSSLSTARSTGMRGFPSYSTTKLNQSNRTVIGWWWW